MKRQLCILVLFFLVIQVAKAQEPILTKREKSATIDSVSTLLQKLYVFPEIATKMSRHLQQGLVSGKYDSSRNPLTFAERLTADLQAISNDKHLTVSYALKEVASSHEQVSRNDESEFIELQKSQKYGFDTLYTIDGHIAYLNLRYFADTLFASDFAHQAMGKLANAKAIIIDLRSNLGGHPEMVQLISSYFFSEEPTHLNNFYFRPSNEYSEIWTLSQLRGTRMPKTPLFILSSNRTFSAAEEFAYTMKQLGRATIIGEVTGGGAHPGGYVDATSKFKVWIPQGRAINPITKTNWEGVGVQPDIEISDEKALIMARLLALEILSGNSKGNDSLEKKIENLKTELSKEITKDSASETQFESIFGTSTPTVFSFRGLVYAIPENSIKLPNFNDLIPIDTVYTDQLNVMPQHFREGFAHVTDQTEWFGIDYEGIFYLREEGNYLFRLGSDDGSRLWIDEKLIIDNDGLHPPEMKEKFVQLERGLHKIRVSYFQGPREDVALVLHVGKANDIYNPFDMKDFQPLEILKEEQSINITGHGGVLFSINDAELNRDAKIILNEIRQFFIESNLIQKIIIEGHTDDVGNQVDNLELSKHRALSVKDYFISLGVNKDLMSTKYFGESNPKYSNHSQDTRSKNRRVEIIIYLKQS